MARKLNAVRARLQAETAAAKAHDAKVKSHRAKTAEAAAKRQERAAGQRAAAAAAWLPFDSTETVLLVGEGDFTFAAALAQQFPALRVIATSLDSEATVREKYPATAQDALQRLSAAEAEILHGINATELSKSRTLRSLAHADGWPLKIVFNFPHLGNSVADQDRNIRQHQSLLLRFFEEARHIGAAHVVVTLFDGEPYESWQPRQLARSAGWAIVRSGRFDWSRFPGYAHQLTAKGDKHTSKAQHQRAARMYLWSPAKQPDEAAADISKPSSGSADDSDSSSENETRKKEGPRRKKHRA